MNANNIHTMLNAYILCALWSSTDESTPEGGEPLDKNYTAADLADETLGKMCADVTKFACACESLIDGEWEKAGHDLWLTRNGHGCGFWDGDWPEETGDKLTIASKSMGESYLIVGDDGRIYAS